MPNQVFATVTKELETHIGDILAVGFTRTALHRCGYTEEDVTAQEMTLVLNAEIEDALLSFMNRDKARNVVRNIIRVLGAETA